MQENKTAQMREYLKLKQIQENDKSDEIIEEIYNKVITKEMRKKVKEKKNSLKKIVNLSFISIFWNEVRKEEK